MQPLNTYLDYRQYLRDFYAEQKRRNPRYSHRLFALKAGLTSTGFLSETLSGKRQLAPAAPKRGKATSFASFLKRRLDQTEGLPRPLRWLVNALL